MRNIQFGAWVAVCIGAFGAGGCAAESLEGDEFETVATNPGSMQNGSGVNAISYSVGVNGCSGVVIHPRVILTAGHCHPDLSTKITVAWTTITATTGVYNNSTTVFAGNARWRVRPDYANTTATDLSIVTLPLPLSGVNTVEMWDGALSTADQIWVYGWGDPSQTSKRGVLFNTDSISSGAVKFFGDASEPRLCHGDSGGAWSTFSPQRVFGLDSRGEKPYDGASCDKVNGWSEAHRLSASMNKIRSTFVYTCDHYGDEFKADGTGSQWIDCSTDETYYMGPLAWTDANKCIDAQNNSSAAQTPLWLWPCSTSSAQQWAYMEPEKQIRFRDNMCADVQWGNLAPGTPVWLWPCTGNIAQRWVRQYGLGTPSSAYNIEGTNLCLDVTSSATGTPLTLQTCDGSSSQRWTFR